MGKLRDLWHPSAGDRKRKVFVAGLSSTATKSVTAALGALGWDVRYCPTDEVTVGEVIRGECDLSLLREADGVSDIMTLPCLRRLLRLYPDALVVRTHRDKQSWLRAMKVHWDHLDAHNDPKQPPHVLRMRSYLLSSVYRTTSFTEELLSEAYDRHVNDMAELWSEERHRWLTLDIASRRQKYTSMELWDMLAGFLNVDSHKVRNRPFYDLKEENEFLGDFNRTQEEAVAIR